MDIVIVTESPDHEALHLDLAGRDVPVDRGLVLTLTDPGEVLVAASASAAGTDWVVWRVATMPASEHRIASFLVTLARRVPGVVYVVLAPDIGREHRIAGHLLRAGARRAVQL